MYNECCAKGHSTAGVQKGQSAEDWQTARILKESQELGLAKEKKKCFQSKKFFKN